MGNRNGRAQLVSCQDNCERSEIASPTAVFATPDLIGEKQSLRTVVGSQRQQNCLDTTLGVQSVKSLPLTFSLAGALLALGIIASPVSALNVSGTLLSGSWRVLDSPVRVTGDIELSADDTLRIEPGVRVEFTGPYVFVVRGVLIASGSVDERIYFTMEAGVPDSLRWGGLRFIQAKNGCRLNLVRIESSWARGVWPRNCGAGIYAESCNPTVTRSEIVGNRADADGGGFYGWFSNASFTNVLFYGNSAFHYGGGLFFSYSNPQIINCTISLDTARAWGGGIFAGAEARPLIVNTIVARNHQLHNLDGTNIDAGDDYTPDFGRAQSARPSVSFSNIGVVPLSPFPGSGNIYLDPGFYSLTPPYDFQLQYSSPNVDGGDPKFGAAMEPDTLVNRIDVGAYGGTEEATPSVPVISVNFAALNFGNYRLNASTAKEIKVENKGHYRLHIRDFRFSSSVFYTDSTETDTGFIPSYLAAPIEPGEQAKFTIYFKPDELRAYRDSLIIVSNDLLFPNPRVNLNGTGIDPVASMEDSLVFERTVIGSRTTKSLWVKNSGQSFLTLSQNSGQIDGFTIEVVDDTISAHDSGEVRVTFAPLRPESYEESKGFSTNDKDLFALLLGRGYGPKFVLPDTSARFLGYVYFNGDTAVSGISIRNDGDSNLVVTSAVVGDTIAFSSVIPNGGLVIPPDSTGKLIVRFHPPVANQVRNTQLTIRSNYPVSQILRLSGRGMSEPGKYVYGPVSGVWDWRVGHDDYIILDSVYVPVNKRLKIEAGARILFEPGAAFIAEGEVRATGTPEDSIYFLPRDISGSEAARWEGISLSFVDASRLSFCVVKSSRNGIVIREASPSILFSTISDNGDSSSTARGGTKGGALHLENSGAVINGCVVERNFASIGGAVHVLNSKPTITNCVIRNNRADDGSAIYLKFLTGGLFQSLVIDGNSAAAGFGAFTAIDRSAPRIVNCTIADNSGVGIRAVGRSLPTVINSIVWGNTAGFELTTGSNALITYTDYPGGLPANKNLNVDPGFVGSPSEPYQLAADSPLIDQGNPEATYRDYFFPPSKSTSRNDIGAYGGPLGGGWGLPEISISLFQNPAFPRWCDVILLAETPFASAPVCSVEFNIGSMHSIALQSIDPTAYRGRLESPTDGTIFLTANGQLSGGTPQKVGRTFEVILTNSDGGTIYLAELGGNLVIPGEGELPPHLVIVSGAEASVKPEAAFLPISSSARITGLAGESYVQIPLSQYFMSGWEYDLALYRHESSGWAKTPSHTERGLLTAFIKGDGEYILAIDLTSSGKSSLPTTSELIQAYPNPFNGGVTIAFDLVAASKVKLTIHDLTGREIETLNAGKLSAGRRQVRWDAETHSGNPLPSGIYWARLEADNGVRSIKLLLVR